eukprot:1158307-Pelagomonas_calceolata.AAC.13
MSFILDIIISFTKVAVLENCDSELLSHSEGCEHGVLIEPRLHGLGSTARERKGKGDKAVLAVKGSFKKGVFSRAHHHDDLALASLYASRQNEHEASE